MNQLNDSKKFADAQLPNDHQMLIPRTFEGKNYYATADIAKILDVTKQTVENWRKRGWLAADVRTHDGIYLYEAERVMQLKEVYHKNWMRGGYQPSPTTATVEPEPIVSCSAAELDASHSNLQPVGVLRGGFQTGVSRGASKSGASRVLSEAEVFRDGLSYDQIFHVEGNVATARRRFNCQVQPSKFRVELNDKQTRVIFSLSEESTNELLDGSTYEIVEKRNFGRVGDIVTSYKLFNADGFENRRPLDQFDRAVLSVCISEYLKGNRFTTVPIIYRGLTGKVNRGSNSKPTKEQRATILESLQVLMSRVFSSDPSAARNFLKYNDGSSKPICSALLPAWLVENVTVNGKDPETALFLREPCPLLAMAQAKKQLLTYDTRLLDIPNQQNTTTNIRLKNYSMIRVKESIGHKQMSPILTFSDVFTKCHLEDAQGETKRRAREFMLAFLAHLKSKEFITSFELTRRGSAFYSIQFSYSFSGKRASLPSTSLQSSKQSK